VGNAWKILPITARSLWSCETQISYNKTVPPNLRAQKVLIKLSPATFYPGGGGGQLEGRFFFSSCIWCGEWCGEWRVDFPCKFYLGAGGGGFIFLSANAKAQGALLLFLFKFGGWVRRFGCAFFGLRV